VLWAAAVKVCNGLSLSTRRPEAGGLSMRMTTERALAVLERPCEPVGSGGISVAHLPERGAGSPAR